MNRFLTVLLMMFPFVVTTPSLLASESCPVKEDSTGSKECERPAWRNEATYTDDSDVRVAAIAENGERQLLSEKVTL